MQNYPYIMPMYQPQGYRYQQPPVMQPQANVDWIQVAWFEAAPSESVQAEPAKEEAPKVYLSDYCADLDKMPKLNNKKGKKEISKKIKFVIDN